jgi:6-pyruvoyltetrahydropterin/6-carboxytetrahydropterin synthase
MYTLHIDTKFASAHQLRGYRGKCENIHGHSWKVQVSVSSETLNDIGLAIDFTDLKRIVDEIVKPLDHVSLNDIAPFKDINPSSENIAKYIFDLLKEKVVPYQVKVKAVTVWESDTASATYTEDRG